MQAVDDESRASTCMRMHLRRRTRRRDKFKGSWNVRRFNERWIHSSPSLNGCDVRARVDRFSILALFVLMSVIRTPLAIATHSFRDCERRISLLRGRWLIYIKTQFRALCLHVFKLFGYKASKNYVSHMHFHESRIRYYAALPRKSFHWAIGNIMSLSLLDS